MTAPCLVSLSMTIPYALCHIQIKMSTPCHAIMNQNDSTMYCVIINQNDNTMPYTITKKNVNTMPCHYK